jgi:hypothetical protein
MGDYNIYVKNMLGRGGSSQNKLSAKGSVHRSKNIVNNSKKLKRISGMASKGISSMSSGSSSLGLSGMMKGAGAAGAIGLLLVAAEKVVSFGINLKEARTGEQVWAHNSRATLKTVTSLGTNYLYGAIQNELFTKKTISRQNYGLDYGRELFQINVEGSKNKRI